MPCIRATILWQNKYPGIKRVLTMKIKTRPHRTSPGLDRPGLTPDQYRGEREREQKTTVHRMNPEHCSRVESTAPQTPAVATLAPDEPRARVANRTPEQGAGGDSPHRPAPDSHPHSHPADQADFVSRRAHPTHSAAGSGTASAAPAGPRSPSVHHRARMAWAV